MTTRRLIELWEPPQGYCLASVLATAYELQADFVEEDLLPVALDLRLSPARGREFRLELERALQDTEVTIFFHPGRYQAGLRRSPRIDLVPVPEGRFAKLHAKLTLLRFVNSAAPEPASQIVRLIVGSANLTASGYRSNIEVAVEINDAPDSLADSATAVRDAAAWLEQLAGPSTEQVTRQLRDIKAVFASRAIRFDRDRLRFIGLPDPSGLPVLMEVEDAATQLTIVSPFWPAGDNLSDVAAALKKMCGGSFGSVRLVGPSYIDDRGQVHPIMPAALVYALMQEGAEVAIAAADPIYGCTAEIESDAEDEFDSIAESRKTTPEGTRDLHAKVLLLVGRNTTRLAIGSFNLTRRGMGLVANSNAEAGLLWTIPTTQAASLKQIVSFATAWRDVDRPPQELVVEPGNRDGDESGDWPAFLLSLYAQRTELVIECEAISWPGPVTIRMRDIRARLIGEEHWFDDWVVERPDLAEAVFSVRAGLKASWLNDRPEIANVWPPLPDLEAEVLWAGGQTTVPVVFVDKHLFPVVETRSHEDEQALIAWFLGLRPLGDFEDGGFGHSIDPVQGSTNASNPTNDILSYLVRDFVHSLPGIRNSLAEGGMTETGLRTAMLGHRSPVELARVTLRALQEPEMGKPRKTHIATVFQLAEIKHLLETVKLPELADGASEALREEAIVEVKGLLDTAIETLPKSERQAALWAYLGIERGRK